MLSAYVELIRLRFLTFLAYRVNYYSGIAVYALNIGVNYYLWKAIYGSSTTLGGMTAIQMTTYIAVSWMARAFYFNNLDRDIANEIRDGSVAIQFIRPYNYLIVKMTQALGEGLCRLLLFTVPGMLVVLLLFPIQLPTNPATWGVFLIMLLFSFVINSQINMLTGLSAFFLENNEGVLRMKRVAVDLLSGLIVPISFFPGWAQSVLGALPFQAVTYLPSSVFTGRVTGSAVWEVLAIQVAWLFILAIPVVLLWRKARARLFVQGG
jgi:ABC-2 type transport system permease protein